MKENNKQTSCESKGSLTQVSTTYARICVILLALNFCVTGYVMTGVLKLQQEAVVQTTTPTGVNKVGVLVPMPLEIPIPTVEVEALKKK